MSEVLRVVTGGANAGKSGRLIASAIASARSGGSPTIVVPTLVEVRRLESELAGKSPLGIRVVTFDQLLVDLWSLSGDGRRIVRGGMRHALMQGVLAQISEASPKRIVESRGFKRLALEAVRSGAEIDELDGTSSGVAAILCRVRDAYRAAANLAGLVERSEAIALLTQSTHDLRGSLHVLRFDTVPPEGMRLLVRLAEANDVVLGLTWAGNTAATLANEETVRLLKARGVIHETSDETFSPGEIQELGRLLFSGPQSLASRSRVVFGVASGVAAECAIAAQAAEEAINSGVAPDRIAVVFPGLEGRRNVLQTALRARRVPFRTTHRIPFASTGFGQALIALVALAAGDGGRPEAERFLMGPFSGADEEAISALDRRWRDRRIEHAGELLGSLATVSPLACRAVRLVKATGTPRGGADGARIWRDVAGTLVESLAACEVRVSGREARPRLQRETLQAHAGACSVIAELAQVPGITLSASEVLGPLRGLDLSPSGDEEAGSVQVCELRDLGSRRFDVLVLGGLTNEEMPIAERERPIRLVPQDEFDNAAGTEGDLARLKFYSAITRARQKLVLLRQGEDEDGSPIRPSPLWEAALEVYRPRGADAEAPLAGGPPIVSLNRAQLVEYAPALSPNRAELRRASATTEYGEVWRYLVAEGAALSADKVFSATEIEDYLACQYRWFYRWVIRPEQADASIDRRVLGIHAHRLLAEFYGSLAREGFRRVTKANLGDVLPILEATIAAGRSQLRVDGSLAEEFDVREAEVRVRALVESDAETLPGFHPEALELRFGVDEPHEFGGLPFRGVVDRIDSDGAGLFLTDYKSSRDVPGFASFEGLGKVQPILYARAVEEHLGRPIVGWAYRSISGGSAAGFWRREFFSAAPLGMSERDAVDKREFAAVVESTQERVRTAAEGMRAGRVARRPCIRGACRGCEIRTVCERSER